MENKKTIGNILMELRTKNGYTQSDVAEKIGISKMSYFRYENDQREPSATIIANLAKIYNVSTDYIIGIGKDKDKDNETKDLINIIETVSRSQATRTLFSLIKNTSEKDIRKIIHILEILKDDETYDK